MDRLKFVLSATALATAAVFAAPAVLAQMGPGREMTRESAQAGAEMLFKRFDLNGDGKLDAADRAAHLAKMFDHIDTNHDGAISREEFAASQDHGMGGPGMGQGMGGHAMGEPGMAMRARAMRMGFDIMREADRQRTGTVTHDAFIAAALRLFDKADANHDGKVTPDERRAAMPHRGPRGGMPDMDHDDMPPPAN